MTDAEKIAFVQANSGESDAAVVSAFLAVAKSEIINHIYPFKPDAEKAEMSVPSMYDTKQCEIATYLLNKRGAEGQTVHNENGINRTYEAACIPASMWRGVTPFCGSMGGGTA